MIVFAVDEKEFSWEEMEIAARLWGEWDALARNTRLSLACLKQAQATGAFPATAEVQRATNDFRQARNLISAEETIAWLAEWGLKIADLTDYIRRSLIMERWTQEAKSLARKQTVSDDEVAVNIKAEALFSGKLSEWAQRLAGQAAISARRNGDKGAPTDSKHEAIAKIDSAFRAFSEQVLDMKALRAQIANNHLDWVRCRCRYIWFGEERLAREAALCVREDGLTLESLAYDSRSVVQEWSFYMDEVEPSARAHFLAARCGDLLGPLNLLYGFPLFSIVDKKLPAADDPQIRERASRAALQSAVQQEVTSRVRWLARM